MSELISFYTDKVNAYDYEIRKTKKLISYTAFIRLIFFISAVVFVYLYIKFQNNLHLLVSIVSFIFFLFFVKRSSLLNAKKLLLEKLFFVNKNEIEILNGNRNKFENGQLAQTNESYYADLDVFGEASLYHMLNRTSSSHGSIALAKQLKHTFTDADIIKQHQSAIIEFASQAALRENIIAKSLMHKEGEGNIDNIQKWLNEPPKILINKWISIARFVLPMVNFFTLILSLYLDHYLFLVTTVIISWMHIGFYSKYINQQHALLGKKQEQLDQYAIILKDFSTIDSKNSSLLTDLKQTATTAHTEVSKLSNLSNLLDQRLNVLVNILLNSFLLYDIHVMSALERWKEKNQMNFAKWIDCVASIETLTSFSTFAFNHPSFTYPHLVDDLQIEAKALAHPLINENERIANDVSLGKSSKLLLITGSNMSGKTTYLRTIGTNILLAQCGAPVCAESFSFNPVHIYTSIRISDSLQDHTSYFMAELKRLSYIKEKISSLQPSLVLIDEILRGTNSEDKYFGSAEFVKKLIQYNCLTLFATHDLKLSELEKEYKGVIENYCFESIIKDDELLFDYKILRGVAQNKNASFLMKKMKII